MTALKNLVRDENGATMVEYGLIVTLIAVAAIAAVRFLGTNIQGVLSGIGSSI